MRSKAPLVLMEQAIMVLVFALAAALCLQAFVFAQRLSLENQARDQALLLAQSAAEQCKANRGDFSQSAQEMGGTWDRSVWRIAYDEDWMPTTSTPCYTLAVTPQDSGTPLLGQALVTVSDDAGVLVELEVCWQEVAEIG
jgi:Tfp pilus assembly protein PilV